MESIKTQAFTVDLKPLKMGKLIFTATPELDLNFLDESGRVVLKLQTPIKSRQIPVGKYRVQMANDIIDYADTMELEIKENQITRVEKILE